MDNRYSAGDLVRLLEVAPAQLKTLVKAALPEDAEPADEREYSFQEMVLLKTAKRLSSSNVSAARIRKALSKLRAQLPDGKPITGVAIAAEGDRVVAKEGDTRWNPESGQVLMDLGQSAKAAPLPAAANDADEDDALTGDDWYELACDLEQLEPSRAVGAYRKALKSDPSHADAHVNLGRLLQERGQPAEAEKHYRAALALREDDATAAYNLGTVLEDLGKLQPAIDAYSEALARHPSYADAHYNLARLYERVGEKVAALRHLKSAHRLARR